MNWNDWNKKQGKKKSPKTKKRKNPKIGKKTDNMNEHVIFFWNGPFSQWHKSDFIYRDIKFNTAEQFMMYQKAVIMGDFSTGMDIIKAKNPGEQKELGRKIKPFDADLWDKLKRHVVYTGNLLKFTQNEDLKKILLNTGRKVIAEASPYDAIWGIGMSEDEAKNIPFYEWKGQNLLGVAIMEVRQDLMKLNETQ